jgi:hypothetical protein
MTYHIRKTIRDEVKNILLNLPTTGTRVYSDYVYSISDKNLPCLVVVTKGEIPNRETIGKPAIQSRQLEMSVYGLVKVNDTYQDMLDQIGYEVETAIYNNITLGGKVKDILVVAIDSSVDDEFEKPTGFINLKIQINYRLRENDFSISV